MLLGEARVREIDNPFAPDYILDAIGVTSRALLPNPRVWRPLMERVLGDITPAATKTYIRLNRLLADRHVLPEIKAELRARSELRPADDGQLLPVFERLIKEVAPPALAHRCRRAGRIAARADRRAVPAASAAAVATAGRGASAAPTAADAAAAAAAPGAATPADSAAGRLAGASAAGAPAAGARGRRPRRGDGASSGQINPYADELARAAPLLRRGRARRANAFGLPQLDPLLALGSLSAVVAALDRWQLLDPVRARRR